MKRNTLAAVSAFCFLSLVAPLGATAFAAGGPPPPPPPGGHGPAANTTGIGGPNSGGPTSGGPSSNGPDNKAGGGDPSSQPAAPFAGQVTAVDKVGLTVTITATDGTELVAATDANTQFVVNGTKATLADIEVGMNACVNLIPGTSTACAIHANTPGTNTTPTATPTPRPDPSPKPTVTPGPTPPPKPGGGGCCDDGNMGGNTPCVTGTPAPKPTGTPTPSVEGTNFLGTITAIDDSGVTFTNPRNESKTATVTSDTKIMVGGKQATEDDLAVGQIGGVMLASDGTTALGISVAPLPPAPPAPTVFAGTVSAVSGTSVTFTDSSGDSKTATITSDTKIVTNGKAGTATDIAVGVSGSVTIAGDGSTALCVSLDILATPPATNVPNNKSTDTTSSTTAKATIFTGTVTAVSATSVTFSDGSSSVTAALVKGTRYLLGVKAGKLADVAVGDDGSIEVSADGKTALAVQIDTKLVLPHGKISAVIGIIAQVSATSVSVRNSAGAVATATVTKNTKIQVNGKTAKISAVVVGATGGVQIAADGKTALLVRTVP